MIEYPNFDKAVIVAGDGDYYCLLKYLESKNKLRKLIIPNRHKYSSLLREFVGRGAAFMNSLQSKLEYQKKREALPRDKTLREASHRDFYYVSSSLP